MEQIDSETLVKYIAQLKETIKSLYIEAEVYMKILKKHNVDYEDDYDEMLEQEQINVNMEDVQDYWGYHEDEDYTDNYIGDGVYGVYGKEDRVNLYIDTEKGPPYYMSLEFYDDNDNNAVFRKYIHSEKEGWELYNQMLEDTRGLTIEEIRKRFLTEKI